MTTQHLPIAQIVANPKQPRKVFNEATLLELSQSIKEHGIIQPIIVEETATTDKYFLVAGERRLRASILAGMTTIEAVIRPSSNHGGREILLSAIIENVQREEMNPIDEAMAYGELNTKHGMSANKISAKVGKTSKHIYDMLNLLNLEKPVQDLLRDGELHRDPRVVKALLKLQKNDQIELAKRAAAKKLKIKTIIEAAERLSEIRGAAPLRLRKNATPSLALSHKYVTEDEEDEEVEPTGWDALAQVGKLPAWSLTVASAKTTCAECELRDMANDATCGRCPLVLVLSKMLEKAS